MSLSAQYDPENIFAKILRGDIPNTTVYEDSDVLSFMDLFPQSEGHTLVIPKHAQAVNLLDIEHGALAAVIDRTQHIAKAVNAALKPDGIQIMQFNGSVAGQTVFHIHFHIIPVWEGRQQSPHGANAAPVEQLRAIAEKIKTCL